MKHSVLIPCYIKTSDNLAMTIRCIELAREKTKLPFELVIVETESNHLVDYADIYIYEKFKTTATKSFNRGMRAIRNEYTIVLTNDVFVDDNWLERLEECFNKKDDCGAATLATNQFNHQREDKIEEGIWGSVFMMPTKLLERVGYYDEDYINSWDDTDLWMKIYKLGYKMYRNFGCVVYHLIRATHGQDGEHNINYEKNRQVFLNKHKDVQDHYMYEILTKGYVV